MTDFQKCLFCYSDSKDKINNNIKSQIRSIFIVRELLDISSSTCISLLQQSQGAHPSSWFSCCGDCSAEITEAENISKKLKKLAFQLKNVKSSLKKKLQQSFQEELEDGDSKSVRLCISDTAVVTTIRDEALLRILEEFGIRTEVKSEDIDCFDPLNVKTENPESETDDEFQNYDCNEMQDKKAVEELKVPVEVPLQRSRFGRLIKNAKRSSDTIEKYPSHSVDNLSDVEIDDDDYSPPKKTIRGKSKRSPKSLSLSRANYLKKESVQIDDNAKLYKCQHCSRAYFDLNKKAAHENRIHGENHNFSCRECSKYYPSMYTLKRHVKTVHGDNMETSITDDRKKCQQCDRDFINLVALKRHEKLDHSNLFACQYCNKLFSTEIRLKLHVFRKHDSTQNPLQCPECGKCLKSRTNFEFHVKTIHRKEKDFICELCSAAFSTNAYLQYHQAKFHGDSKELQCKECGKIFSHPFSLRKHIQSIHRGQYKFICPICGSGKHCKSALDLHVRQSHSNGPRPFPCTICTKTFLTRAYLQIHMRYHSGERPFKCKLCPSAFYEKKKLTRHVSGRHSKERTFECKICQKKFPSQHYLTNHIYGMHNNKKSSLPPKKIADKEQLEQILMLTKPNQELQPTKDQDSDLDSLPQTENDVITGIEIETPKYSEKYSENGAGCT